MSEQNSYTLRPIYKKQLCQDNIVNRLVISPTLLQEIPINIVQINGKILMVQTNQQTLDNQLWLTQFLKPLIFGLDSMPQQITVSVVDPMTLIMIQQVQVYLHYYGTKNQYTKEFTCEQLEKKFRQLFNREYINDEQVLIFQLGKARFDARIDLSMNQYKNGYIDSRTNIVFKKQLHQKFILKKQSKNSESSKQTKPGTPNKNIVTDEAVYRSKLKNMNVGGLSHVLEEIYIKIFASRQYGSDYTDKYGLTHTKGILLYGPPGTGKTLLARQLSKIFDVKPIVVNGPEIMDKHFGQGERKLRQIFEPAQKQWQQRGSKSNLHIIILDEIDSIAKKRGSDAALGDSLVNQLLTLIDGVDSPNNILVIGMTNRKDLIDDALLRPGRLELHIEVFLPDQKGRKQIFDIHMKKIKDKGELAHDVDTKNLAKTMKNYTGAQISSIVKSAMALALVQYKQYNKGQGQFKLKLKHLEDARRKITPQFGQDEKQIQNLRLRAIIPMHKLRPQIRNVLNFCQNKYNQSNQGKYTLLIKGPPRCGKSSLAAQFAKKLDIPFTKLITCTQMIGLNQNQKAQHLIKVFNDSKRCQQSCIVFDDLFGLVEYVQLSSKFNNSFLQIIINIIKAVPQPGKKQIVIATSNEYAVLSQFGFTQLFPHIIQLKPDSSVYTRQNSSKTGRKISQQFKQTAIKRIHNLKNYYY